LIAVVSIAVISIADIAIVVAAITIISIAAIAIAVADGVLVVVGDFLCEKHAETFGKDTIPGDGPLVGTFMFSKTWKCRDKEMSKVPTGEDEREFLLLATEMESLLFNE